VTLPTKGKGHPNPLCRGRSEAVTKLGDGVSVSLCPSYALSFNQALNSAPHLITDGPHLVPG
jgi:hypothetical protein